MKASRFSLGCLLKTLNPGPQNLISKLKSLATLNLSSLVRPIVDDELGDAGGDASGEKSGFHVF